MTAIDVFAEAIRKFAPITRENEQEVKAWIHAQLEQRGQGDAHYTPPANVRPFREIAEELVDEDGYR